MRWLDRAIELAALAAGGLVAFTAFGQAPGNFTTLQASGTATLTGDTLLCSGRPWIDVRCNGAVGDDSHDDTDAFAATIATAVAGGYPLHIPAGSYKITSALTIDYAGEASSGFRLISEGATLDGRAIAAGPVLQVKCSGGTPSSPANCFYFKEEGSLFVNADTPAYAVVIGNSDFSDARNSLKIDHLIVNNASTAPAAGGCQLNYVLDSEIYAVCDAAGGAAGLALEQTQFTRIAGAGTAAGTGGASLLMEHGYNYSNTVFAFDFEVSPTCLAITFPHNGLNTFISPFLNCTTAVNATASTGNVLINPNYGGDVVNRGPQSVGISVIGTGSFAQWNFPATAMYTAAGVDTGTALSSYNAPGTSMSVTLPAPSAVGAGWWMGFATDNGKGMTVTAPEGSVLAGGKALSSVTLGAGNYEYLQLQSDGNNFRVITATRNTLTANGLVSRDWPGNWLYPSSSGYAATLADNGNVLSSYNTTGGLTVTLPSTTGLPPGWSIGLATDSGKGLAVQVDATNGGHIVYPQIAANAVTSLSLAGNVYEFAILQYDGSGNFRLEQVTPATAQQLGVAGTGGISRWGFPSTSAYAAAPGDNGTMISSFNTPLAYMAVTLPPTTGINAGWTIGITADNGKTMAVQVNGTSGGRILYPGSGSSVVSLALAAYNYETAILQYDGSGSFRVVEITPASAAGLAMPGSIASGITRWSFPSVSSYTATVGDNGNAISAYNTPTGGMTIHLPATSTIVAGWTIAAVTDNGKTMTIEVNGGAGEQILAPGTLGAVPSLSLATAFSGYELVILQFDGSNYRISSVTPLTADVNGMAMPLGTPSSSSATCQTGALQFDSNFLYACTGPNTWKRAAWSSF